MQLHDHNLGAQQICDHILEMIKTQFRGKTITILVLIHHNIEAINHKFGVAIFYITLIYKYKINVCVYSFESLDHDLFTS